MHPTRPSARPAFSTASYSERKANSAWSSKSRDRDLDKYRAVRTSCAADRITVETMSMKAALSR